MAPVSLHSKLIFKSTDSPWSGKNQTIPERRPNVFNGWGEGVGALTEVIKGILRKRGPGFMETQGDAFSWIATRELDCS